MSTHKLSLLSAIFININIMLGAGTFVNTVVLAQKVGGLGGLLYLAAAAIMFPLILCMARLTSTHAGGSFYTFGSQIHSFWGFLSSWSYFIGKLASAALGVHVFSMFLQDVVPALQATNTLTLDTVLIALFVALNLLHVKTGSTIQHLFLLAKLTPVFFIISYGLHYAKVIYIKAPHLIWSGIPVALPLTLFCFLGFEATCSLAGHIEDSKRNAPRAILFSFAIVILLSILYQTLFYASLGPNLASQPDYTDAFPLFINRFALHLARVLIPGFSIAIAISALGAAYGIIYSNSWNLFALGKNNHIMGAHYFTQLNKQQIPYLCVIAQGAVCLMHLYCSGGAQVPLQYTSTLACITAYTISVMSLFFKERSTLSIIGLVSCAVALSACLKGFLYTSLDPLIRFIVIIGIGIAMFLVTRSSSEFEGHQSNET